ncbi:hypothetical protein AVEN_219306-1 [Araneus ventricosus]|uniref:Uncharacterized protein n=1 Tax=Araneus ventricosus TaxID=182803 RepID=A0A4Y2BH71_ARAVE|nr:hypothetical protein AVEN_219306-1 [Araneus ventricosus]
MIVGIASTLIHHENLDIPRLRNGTVKNYTPRMLLEISGTAVGCSLNKRKVFGRRGALHMDTATPEQCVYLHLQNSREVPSGSSTIVRH